MLSQLYLSGRLAANPELGQTKKGYLQVKILLATELVRKDGSGFQAENVVLPISFFGREAEAIQSLTQGDFITLGGKFPRLTKKEARARLKEIKRLLLAL